MIAKSAPARHLRDEALDVAVEVGRARVLLRERRHADAEVAERLDEPDELLGVLQALGVLDPLGLRVARRVAAQRQHVAHAGRRAAGR